MVCSFVPSNSIYMQTQQPTTKTTSRTRVLKAVIYLLTFVFWYSIATAGSSSYTVCQNGSVVINSSGGTGSWTAHPGNPGTSHIQSTISSSTTVNQFSVAGIYAYIWASGTNRDTAYVTVQATPSLTVTGSSLPCFGATTGNICVSVSGGTGSYSYIWSGGGGVGSCVTNAGAGTYAVTVTDANGCTSSASGSVTQPASAFSVTAAHTDITCHGNATGTITLTASGGTYPYTTAAWSDGDTGIVRTGMAAGTYSYTIADANGCQQTGVVTVAQPAAAFNVTVSHTNAGCISATGTISLTETGGTTPYNAVIWSGGLTGTNPVNVAAGNYTYSVTDANNCPATGSVIVSASGLAIADSVFNVTCNGAADGRMVAVAYGGASPYTYQWSNGANTPQITNLTAAVYYVTATDNNGCTITLADSIRQPSPITLTVSSVTNATCHGRSDGSACVVASGGSGNYIYTWAPAMITTACMNGAAAGTYSVSATDMNGCSTTAAATILQPSPLVVTDSVVNESYPGATDGAIYLSVTGGTAPYMYTWTPPITITTTALSLAVGTYTVSVIDANGCGATDTALVAPCTTCIWPGDADDNLLVDNNDLLPIGLGYNSTGPARVVTSIVWQGNAATDWTQAFGSYTPAVNYKYADCNGDGVINATDTTAIVQNFGLTHNKTILRKPWRTGDPVIYPLLSKDTVTNGDTLTVDIHLGDVSLTANNVYGLAYTINYDPAVLDTTKTTFMYGNSWLGSATDMISISRDIPAQGLIKTAVTRIDHTTRSGSGIIAHMRAIVTTDNIDGKDLSYYPVQIIISDVRAIDQQGNILQVNEGADSTEVAYTPLGLHDIAAAADISVYPNPANGLLHISTAITTARGAEVVTVLGETAASYTWSDMRRDHSVDVSGLSSGVYYIRIQTAAGAAVRKITITR